MTIHRHLLLLLVLLLGIVAVGVWRMLPERPAPVAPCRHPVGVLHDGRPEVICLGAPRAPLRRVAAHLGRTRCRPRGQVRAGELVALGPDCAVRRGPMPGPLRLTLGLPIDVNQATAQDLRALPRIGPTLARRIVEDRRRRGPFPSVAALQRVRGIGPVTVRRLRGLVSATAAR